mmetsp:Transcript_53373/g.134013  ORF Transcript_53373/g.134013 Transcript_53373/m.134013 type:complete len:235 (-) Transcript_53373:133-837(-)
MSLLDCCAVSHCDSSRHDLSTSARRLTRRASRQRARWSNVSLMVWRTAFLTSPTSLNISGVIDRLLHASCRLSCHSTRMEMSCAVAGKHCSYMSSLRANVCSECDVSTHSRHVSMSQSWQYTFSSSPSCTAHMSSSGTGSDARGVILVASKGVISWSRVFLAFLWNAPHSPHSGSSQAAQNNTGPASSHEAHTWSCCWDGFILCRRRRPGRKELGRTSALAHTGQHGCELSLWV